MEGTCRSQTPCEALAFTAFDLSVHIADVSYNISIFIYQKQPKLFRYYLTRLSLDLMDVSYT